MFKSKLSPCPNNRFQQALHFQGGIYNGPKNRSRLSKLLLTEISGGIGKVSNLEIIIKDIIGKAFPRSIKRPPRTDGWNSQDSGQKCP